MLQDFYVSKMKPLTEPLLKCLPILSEQQTDFSCIQKERWINPWCFYTVCLPGWFSIPSCVFSRRMYQRGWSTNSSYIGRTVWTSFHLGICRNWDENPWPGYWPNMGFAELVVFDGCLVKMPQGFVWPTTRQLFRGVVCGNKSNIRSAEFSHIFLWNKMTKKNIENFLSFARS